MRIAEVMGKPVGQVKRMMTSTEYVDWSVYLDEREWKENSKNDYQLALIAFEVHLLVHSFRRFLGDKTDKMPKFEEFLLKFGTEADPTKDDSTHSRQPTPPKVVRPEDKDSFEKGYGLEGIDTDAPVLDDKWKKVTQAAKAEWCSLIPPEMVVSYTPGIEEVGHGN